MPRPVVGTGLFWQKALAEEPLRAPLAAVADACFAGVQSLTVILLALAAAGPEIPAARRIVLILDNSATMRATDVQPSRFEAAKEEARRMIASLRWCDAMAIVTTSPVPQEVHRRRTIVALLRAAIDAVAGDGRAAEHRLGGEARSRNPSAWSKRRGSC